MVRNVPGRLEVRISLKAYNYALRSTYGTKKGAREKGFLGATVPGFGFLNVLHEVVCKVCASTTAPKSLIVLHC